MQLWADPLAFRSRRFALSLVGIFPMPNRFCACTCELRVDFYCRFLLASCRFEHAGISEAVETAMREGESPKMASQHLSKLKPVQRPLGVVVAAYIDASGRGWAIGAINSRAYPRLCETILGGTLKSVSLTTVKLEEGPPHPLELSLCSFPARPGSNIVWCTESVQKAMTYKRQAETRAHTLDTTMEEANKAAPMQTETPVNPFTAALDKLSPEDRAVIESRFEEIVGKYDLTQASATSLQEKLEEITKAAEADKAMLKQQVDLFLENTKSDAYKGYGMESCAKSVMDSTNANEMRRAVDRMLTVANREFASRGMAAKAPVVADQRMTGGEATPKRSRVEPEPVAVESTPAPQTALQRAFAATFN
jgi:hypothetical protein